MHIDIQARGVLLTDALRDHTERRLRYALAPAANRVRRIKVHFSDVNGPRGGVDQRCRIQATMEGLGEVIIEDIEANPFRAIAIGAGRIGRSILRRLRRRKTHSRADARRVWGADNSDNAQL